FVFGAAGPVVGVLRQHLEYGLAFVLGKTRRSSCHRRSISQLSILKVKLPLGHWGTRRRSFVFSVHRDGHVCAFVSLLPGNPPPPIPRKFLDVDDLLLSSNSMKRRQSEHGPKQ